MHEPLFAPEDCSRREFLRLAGAGAGVSLAATESRADTAPLPQRVLGRTRVRVPILGLGTAPTGHRPEKDATAFFHRCLDAGVTYVDTAPEFTGYGKSQVYLKQVLRERRKEVFLVTKCFEPEGEKALQLLKKNLHELGVEQVDLVYAHNLGDDRMVPEKVYAPTGVCKALEKAQRDGLTRFLGVSAHHRPGRMLQAMKEWDFDVLMNAVNLVVRHVYDFETTVWPIAAKKGIALVAMKVFGGFGGRQKPKGARLPDDLKQAGLRYALGLPHCSLAVIGMHDDAELTQNLQWVRDYRPLSAEELQALERPSRTLAAQWKAVHGPAT